MELGYIFMEPLPYFTNQLLRVVLVKPGILFKKKSQFDVSGKGKLGKADYIK